MTGAGPARADVAGIVLAGGRSSRFGSDKLTALVDGRTLLDRAIEPVASVTGSVLVVVPPGRGRSIGTPPWWPDRGIVIEDPTPYEGPLAGLAVGLAAIRANRVPLALVAPGDAPWMVPAVLALLLDELRATDAAAALLMRGGRAERFPFAVRAAAAEEAVAGLLAAGRRRLAELTARLGPLRIEEERWRALDPEGLTLRDVDRPEDLEARPPR